MALKGAPRLRRTAILTAILGIALLVAGCAQVSFFPRTQSAGGGPILMGHITGKLILDSGCLWLESGSQRDLLIWGSSYGLSSRNWDVEVTRNASVVGVVGREITVTGGEFTRDSSDPPVDAWIESQIGQKIPTACRLGTYFLVEGVIPSTPAP